jgi:hypothetical protein
MNRMDKKIVKRKTGLYLIIALAFISRAAYNQLLTIDMKLDTNRILIGDQVNMSIKVIKPENSSVIFPQFGANLTDEIEIVNKSEIDSSKLDDNKVALYQNLTITAFDSGLMYIPPAKFVYQSGRFTDSINSPAEYLEVLPVEIDTTGTIRDIKGIYKAPYSFSEIYPFILALIFTGLLIWFILYYIDRKKKDKPILRRIRPPEMPHVIALRELDRLKAEKLWQQNKVKLYYTRLTEIIRSYIERRFDIMAMEQTTSEILYEFREKEIENVNYNILEQLLNLADLVKFARGEPLPEENITHMENAYEFVKSTKYVPAQQNGAEDNEINNKQTELTA